MRTTLIAIVITFVTFGLSAQTAEKPWSINNGLAMTDFASPITKEFTDLSEWKGTGRIGINKYLSPSFNTGLQFSFGRVFIPRIADVGYDEVIPGLYERDFLLDLGWNLEYKLNNGYIIDEDAVIGPFINTGFGVNNLYDDYNTYVPLGVGFNFQASKSLSVILNSTYKINVDNSYDYLQHMAGIGLNFGKGKKDDAIDPLTIDTDLDGVPDTDDECPFVAGTADMFGCPDSDGDGLSDARDICPNESGPKTNRGCPISDKDGDGIEDSKDRCPDLAGDPRYLGCPDSDGDGVPDDVDKCVDEKGTRANEGCPEVLSGNGDLVQSFSIYFEGSSKVLSTAEKGKLNEVVTYLKDRPAFGIKINGHTCDVGSDEKNAQLSMDRALVVWEFLSDAGIPQKDITVFGYGEHELKYEERTMNRRVDIEVYRK